MNLKEQIKAYIPWNEVEEGDKKAMLQCMEMCEDVLTRENLMAHMTASSWIVNTERTKVLMIHHNIMNQWAWTGGHADGETNLLNVALREATEETGITKVRALMEDIFSLEVLYVAGHYKRGKYVNPHIHLNVTYLLEADEEEQTQIKEDENSGVRWFSLEDAEKQGDKLDVGLYHKLNEKLKAYLKA